MYNIAIMGCGKIAPRIANGIIYSDGLLYAVASRDKERAKAFAVKYPTCKFMNYEELLADEKVDLVYIATINETHYDLIKRCLNAGKNVICEKPMLPTQEKIKEVFSLAREKGCFLMEAHKTCFTVLNTLLRTRVEEIGPIQRIEAKYCGDIDVSKLKENINMEPTMGGACFDIGVYPICFANLYAKSPLTNVEIVSTESLGYPVDIETVAKLTYENGIIADVKASWRDPTVNKGILYGEKGRIEIVNFWKNTEATIYIGDTVETVKVEQASDFTGEVNEALRCLKEGKLTSDIMSEEASLEICKVLEELKKHYQ